MNSGRLWWGLGALALAGLGWGWLYVQDGGLWVKIKARREFVDSDGFQKSYEDEFINLVKPGKTYMRTLEGRFVPNA